MGIALILLGLLAAGIVVDFAAENWSVSADLTFELFGARSRSPRCRSSRRSRAGAVAVALCIVGRAARGSRGRRRDVRRRVADSSARTQRSSNGACRTDQEAHSDDRPVIVESQR
jgi:hypothetical protein